VLSTVVLDVGETIVDETRLWGLLADRAEVSRLTLFAVLRSLGTALDFVASSAGWGVEKPALEFFERVCSESGVPRSEIAYVGDRLDNDVLPAREAGMVAVFIRRGPWGHLHAHWPEAGLADARIDSLSELPGGLAGVESLGVGYPSRPAASSASSQLA
jgi:hypothetical protein